MRELKMLYDPEGIVTPNDCYQDPQETRIIDGHFCFSNTDCQQPSASNSDGHTWQSVKMSLAGMYAVCYCDSDCSLSHRWSFIKWHLVAGPYSNLVWSFSRGIHFDLEVDGWGLSTTNRLRIVNHGSTCGHAAASPTSGVNLPASAPVQLEDRTQFAMLAALYVYDGTLLRMARPHGLKVEEHVSLSGIRGPNCGYCADLLNGRPHKALRDKHASKVDGTELGPLSKVFGPTRIVLAFHRPSSHSEKGVRFHQYATSLSIQVGAKETKNTTKVDDVRSDGIPAKPAM